MNKKTNTEDSTKAKDWCTSFPEYWHQWYIGVFYIPMWRKVYIGDCCKIHDEDCETKAFIRCLKEKNIVGRYLITIIAATACLVRYGKV